ncbi:MAG: hypothetical protein ACOCVF_01090 [bacterium]
MRNSISLISKRYRDYVAFCGLINQTPVSIHDDFLEDEQNLLKKHGYVKNSNSYKKQEII